MDIMVVARMIHILLGSKKQILILTSKVVLWSAIGQFFIESKAFALNKMKTFESRTFEVEGGTTYFDSNMNFNSNGTKVGLIGSNKYTLLESYVSSRYVFPDAWSVSAKAFLNNAESKNTDFNRSNSTFSAVEASADFILYRGIMDLAPEFTFRYALDTISPTQDSVMTNEGVLELTAMLKAQNNYSWFAYYLGAGFNFRSERSGLFPWNIGAGVKWGNASFLGAEIGGFQSIVDDGDKGVAEAARYSLVQKVDGGSYRFYSVNPNHVYAAVNADLGFSRGIVIKTSYATSLSGQNYSSGSYISASLAFLFDAFSNRQDKRISVPVEKPEKVIESPKEDYKIQTDDGVDQTLFQKEPETPKAPVKSAPKKELTNEEIQNQLDEAEMTIKLKSNKKKKKK